VLETVIIRKSGEWLSVARPKIVISDFVQPGIGVGVNSSG
jgi:hypothetical protein